MVESVSRSDDAPRTLVELLEAQASRRSNRCAYMFRGDDESETSLTFAELDLRARVIAATLQSHISPGERALLVYPAGLDFIAAFFGCLYAGVLAVPATYPKPRRPLPRLSMIARDSQATMALTTAQTLTTLDLARTAPELRGVQWVATDELPDAEAHGWQRPAVEPDSLAFLQYTSGSISDPKGVMVSHANLMRNLEMIRRGFDIGGLCPDPAEESGVSWLPAYHDMGLIGGILESLYVGGQSVLMSPTAFLQRPFRWLKAISDYRAVISGAPNFAYELCAQKIGREERNQLELSNWKLAFCGAEPIRAETLEKFAETFAPCGFRADAFYPCYGMAETTLLAAGGRGPSRPVIKPVKRSALAEHRAEEAEGEEGEHVQRLVGCGRPLMNQQLIIVDPETRLRVGPDRVGEIWVRGDNVARGYWNRPDENEETFGARLADTEEGPFLRTGDLAFFTRGQLYIVGRRKELILIRGRNHYPQDIELTAGKAHAALESGAGAAFSVTVDGEERLVVVYEVDRQFRQADLDEVIMRIRRAVSEEHELEVYAVVLIRPANLPRTTSGKAQRNLCRQRYLDGQLKVLAEWVKPTRPTRRAEAPAVKPSNGNGAVRLSSSGNGNGHAENDLGGPAKIPTPEIPDLSRPLRPDEVERLAEQIEGWLIEWLQQRAGVMPSQIDRDRPLADYGLDSLTAVQLSQELEDWLHVEITAVVAWNYPTLRALSTYLAQAVAGTASSGPEVDDEVLPTAQPNEFERLLAEIENLSDSEVEAALDHKPPSE